MKNYSFEIDITGNTSVDYKKGEDMHWYNVSNYNTKTEAIKNAKKFLKGWDNAIGVRVVKWYIGDDENEPLDLVEDVFIQFKK